MLSVRHVALAIDEACKPANAVNRGSVHLADAKGSWQQVWSSAILTTLQLRSPVCMVDGNSDALFAHFLVSRSRLLLCVLHTAWQTVCTSHQGWQLNRVENEIRKPEALCFV